MRALNENRRIKSIFLGSSFMAKYSESQVCELDSPDALTMRSGGGVLRMKHLICPFSPCKAC